MCIAEPAADRHSVLWVKDVTRRRIVDNDGVLELAADLTEILDIVSLVVVAAFAEESVMDNVVDV